MIIGELTLEVAFAPVGITTAVPVTVSLPSSVVANSPVATTKLLPLSSVSPKPEVAITPVGMVVAVPVTVSLPSAVVPCKSFPSIRTVTFDVVATVSLPTAVLACRSSPSITTVTFDVVATVSLPTAPVADTPEGVAIALSSVLTLTEVTSINSS